MPGLLGGALIDDVQHRADAVLDVEITFPLRTVTEDFQAVGMFEQLLVEIKNVAVRVTLPEDGNKPKNVAF